MGPRSFDHGNTSIRAGERIRAGASMGPRSFDHGNLPRAIIKKYGVTKLQWGHGLSTMETSS